MQSGGPPPLHAQISSLSQFHSNQSGNNYASSPESNASAVSPHTSPRNNHRDINRSANGVQGGGTGMVRYGSGSGLREQIAQSGANGGRATPPPPPASSGSGSRHAYPGPEFWNAIDPSLEGGRSNNNNNNNTNNQRNGKSNGKSNDSSNENSNSTSPTNTNRTNSEAIFNGRGGAGIGAGVGMAGYAPQNSASGGPAFSFPSAEQFGGATSSQNSSSLPSRSNHPTFESGSVGGPSAALASREPQRFSFSTGPLSPFSNAALSSSTSPYLSAFSNARDTPLVSSPRGSTSGAPGTPGGSGNNSFDWSMRPPNKPANRASTGGSSGTPGNNPATQVQASTSGNVPNDTPTKKGLQAKRLSVGSTSLLPSTSGGVSAPGIAAPLLAGVTSSSSGSGSSNGGGTHTPSRFVSRSIGNQPTNYFDFSSEGSSGNVAANVTPSSGPDAFLMNALNGNGMSDSRINASEHNHPSNLSNSLPSSGINMAALFGLNSNGHLATPATPLWDFANMSGGQTSAGLSGNPPSFGLTGPLTNSNQNSSLGWLMSPSIQQLLNSFSEPTAGGNVSPSPRPALPSHDSYFPPQRPLTESQVAAGLDDDPNFQAILSSQTESNSVNNNTNSSNIATMNGIGVATPGGTGSLALERAFKDIANPFFIPPTLFRSCYAIAHWALPPLTRLSMLALHSQQNLLKHFPIMHEPTFRLDT